MMNKILSICALILYWGATLHAQNNVSLNLAGEESLARAMDKLDEATPFTIFHNIDATYPYQGPSTIDDLPLADALEQMLNKSRYGFIPYRGYAWSIVEKDILEKSYSKNYYEILSGSEEEDENTIAIGDIGSLSASGIASINGVITDEQTGEAVIGATVSIGDIGTTTDIDGRYELQVPSGSYDMVVAFIGYQDVLKSVEVKGNGSLDLPMPKSAIELETVTISGRSADANLESVEIGVQTLSVRTIEKLPTFMGEVDVVKSFLLQPGVSSIGEGSSGINVRGGNVDQNLIMQDESFIFNASHALGFFSTFNSNLISSVNLYKANIPAQYGGRLVSVMEVNMRDGNFQKFKIKGGLGPISSKVSLEGPIIKDKVSFIGGFRSSYSDWLLQAMPQPELKNSSSFFYDANLKLTIKPNAKHNLSMSAYSSQDDFVYNDDFGFDYTTKMAEFSYGLIIGKNITSKLSGAISQYESAQKEFRGVDAARIRTGVDYIKLKENIKYVPSEGTEINVGGSIVQYDILPGDREPIGDASLVSSKTLENEMGREMAVYANAKLQLTEGLDISAGVRVPYFQQLGPKTEYQYSDETRPTVDGIIGTELKDGTLATYSFIEPRGSARLKLTEESSLKAGYSRTSQFINQIFNADSPTPTSQWQLSNRYIKPPRSHNASFGYFRNFDDNLWETSIEVYGREIDQLFDFKDFPSLLVNEHIETELLEGEGRSYGAELSIKKSKGKINGWLSYTYSKTERKIEGINKGNWYPSSFDKRHDVSLLFNYNPNQRNTLTCNLNFSTGRPTTAPVGSYNSVNGVFIPVFSERNALRIPNYMRLDLSYTLGNGYKVNQKFKTSWTIAVYNVLGRRNPYSIFYERATFDRFDTKKFSVVGSAFPSITINFELL